MPDIDKIYQHIADNKCAHLENIKGFLKQRSVSKTGEGVRECAELLMKYYDEELKCDEVSETRYYKGHPIVWSYYDAGSEKTILNYCVYDVESAEEEGWTIKPFEPDCVNGKKLKMPRFECVLVGRGAVEKKGPYRAWLNALESIIAVEGKLPVNIIFLAEGEEVLGSPSLERFVKEHRDKIAKANAVLEVGAYQNKGGKIDFYLGNKGKVQFQLKYYGDDWGGPTERNVHSSLKPILDNPVEKLVKAVASMTSQDGKIAIDGLRKDISSLVTSEDSDLLDKLVQRFNDQELKSTYKVTKWMDNANSKKDLLRRLAFGSTLCITGIWGSWGKCEEDSAAANIIPQKSWCVVDTRFAFADRKSDEIRLDIENKVNTHLCKFGHHDVEANVLNGYGWSRTSINEDIVQSVLSVYRKRGIETRIWPCSRDSYPMYVFSQKPLSLPVCRAGIGHGGHRYSTDEYLVIKGDGKVGGLLECEKSYVDILYSYAES